MEPQSSRSLSPYVQNGITQTIVLSGVEYGKGNMVKMRWKVGYRLGNETVRKEEIGEIASLGIA